MCGADRRSRVYARAAEYRPGFYCGDKAPRYEEAGETKREKSRISRATGIASPTDRTPAQCSRMRRMFLANFRVLLHGIHSRHIGRSGSPGAQRPVRSTFNRTPCLFSSPEEEPESKFWPCLLSERSLAGVYVLPPLNGGKNVEYHS